MGIDLLRACLILTERLLKIGTSGPEGSNCFAVLRTGLRHIGLFRQHVAKQRGFLFVLFEDDVQFFFFGLLCELRHFHVGTGFAQFSEMIAEIDGNLVLGFGEIQFALFDGTLLFIHEVLLVAPVVHVPFELDAKRIYIIRQALDGEGGNKEVIDPDLRNVVCLLNATRVYGLIDFDFRLPNFGASIQGFLARCIEVVLLGQLFRNGVQTEVGAEVATDENIQVLFLSLKRVLKSDYLKFRLRELGFHTAALVREHRFLFQILIGSPVDLAQRLDVLLSGVQGALRLQQRVIGIFDRVRYLLLLLSFLLLGELFTDLQGLNVEINAVELGKGLIGLGDTKAGKLWIRRYYDIVRRIGNVTDIAKRALVEIHAHRSEKGTGGHLHIEMRKTLGARGQNLVVRGQDALLRDFDQTVTLSSFGQSLIQREHFRGRRALLRECADTRSNQKEDGPKKNCPKNCRGNPQMSTWSYDGHEAALREWRARGCKTVAEIYNRGQRFVNRKGYEN